MIAIIGVLAAVAIPAYNAYQDNAKVGVVKSSLQQISKAYNACLAVGETVTNCGGSGTPASTAVNGTVRIQTGTTVASNINSMATQACFLITFTNGGQKACLQLDDTGNPGTFPTDANIKDTTMGACAAGVCTN